MRRILCLLAVIAVVLSLSVGASAATNASEVHVTVIVSSDGTAQVTQVVNFHLEQVQDFTPTPMTVSTETWHTGFHPYTLQPIFSAKSQRDKLAQRQFFFWYKPDMRRAIMEELRRMGRRDLIDKLFGR